MLNCPLCQPPPRKQAHQTAIRVKAGDNAAVFELTAKCFTCQNIFFKQRQGWRQNVAANLVALDGLQQAHANPAGRKQQKTGENNNHDPQQALAMASPVGRHL